MATPLENYRTALANYSAELAAVSAERKLSYTVGGRTFDWLGYQRFLMEMIRETREQIAILGGGGGEYISEGFT